jgi:hypothetical protein
MWGNGNIVSRIDVFDTQDTSFSFMNLDRPLMDFKTPGYGGKAAVIGGTSFPNGSYTQYNTVKVYEDLNWINSIRNKNLLDFTIFPNPASDKVFIKLGFDLKSDAEITLKDLSGKVILRQALNASQNANTYEQNKSDISSGIYILSLRKENTISSN